MAKENGQNPALVLRIIKCESNLKQEARRKNYRNGVHWSTDIGVFQVNDYYHLKRAQSLNLDIYSTSGNLTYGFILLKEQGTKPWNWSAHCWK